MEARRRLRCVEGCLVSANARVLLRQVLVVRQEAVCGFSALLSSKYLLVVTPAFDPRIYCAAIINGMRKHKPGHGVIALPELLNCIAHFHLYFECLSAYCVTAFWFLGCKLFVYSEVWTDCHCAEFVYRSDLGQSSQKIVFVILLNPVPVQFKNV